MTLCGVGAESLGATVGCPDPSATMRDGNEQTCLPLAALGAHARLTASPVGRLAEERSHNGGPADSDQTRLGINSRPACMHRNQAHNTNTKRDHYLVCNHAPPLGSIRANRFTTYTFARDSLPAPKGPSSAAGMKDKRCHIELCDSIAATMRNDNPCRALVALHSLAISRIEIGVITSPHRPPPFLRYERCPRFLGHRCCVQHTISLPATALVQYGEQ